MGLLQQISFPLTFADWGGYVFSWDNKLLNFTSALSTSLVFAAFVMIVFAFADPVISEQERVYTTRGSDIIFVLDTSPSMAARDIGGGTRIDAAKQAAHSLVQKNSGASYGLVAMGNEAAIVVPPTSDLDYFESRLSSLTLGEMGEGTALGTGLSSAIYHLSTSMAPRKSIVLITDGEN
ncbi:MAG: VWA domain-containing protein, partial [Treponema sp.]|nr:VWA domain-containing protein [Treponema sp.]